MRRAGGLRPGTEAAFGPRHSRNAAIRARIHRALEILGRRPGDNLVDYLHFTPTPRSVAEYSDLCARVSCYLGDIDVPIYLPPGVDELDSRSVPYMDPALVRDPGWLRTKPAGRGFLMVHRLTPGSLAALVSSSSPGGAVVDPDLYKLSELKYWRVRERIDWPNFPSADMSLARLRARADGAKRAFILATGPSALTVDLEAIDAEVRITCNSAVRDVERLAAFRPTILAFTDPVFHFGPSRYAAEFRTDMLRAVEICDPLLLCSAEWVAPLLNLLPNLRDRLVVIPFSERGTWRWPTERNPTVKLTGSVLTNLMLPVALMLTDQVAVAGADGRKPSENYFWKHGLQYSDDLMRTVFDAHPAFFRDVDYADYYEQYCVEIEEIFGVAERAGKTIVGAAPSWIPALRARGAGDPEAAMQ